jgi:hypothetical protein
VTFGKRLEEVLFQAELGRAFVRVDGLVVPSAKEAAHAVRCYGNVTVRVTGTGTG